MGQIRPSASLGKRPLSVRMMLSGRLTNLRALKLIIEKTKSQ